MRNLIQATLYPGIGAIEGPNVSVGRGTDTPFEQIGAPWIDGVALADAMNARALPGIRFYPVRFTPTTSKYANEACGGVFMIVTDRLALHPVRVGVEIAAMLQKTVRDEVRARHDRPVIRTAGRDRPPSRRRRSRRSREQLGGGGGAVAVDEE